MFIEVNFCMFQDEFRRADRSENFSYEALRALFEYLRGIELDVIALCCEYQEIDCDDSDYANYIGDDAERADLLIAELRHSLLVREG